MATLATIARLTLPNRRTVTGLAMKQAILTGLAVNRK
jgi:hypothetical protein